MVLECTHNPGATLASVAEAGGSATSFGPLTGGKPRRRKVQPQTSPEAGRRAPEMKSVVPLCPTVKTRGNSAPDLTLAFRRARVGLRGDGNGKVFSARPDPRIPAGPLLDDSGSGPESSRWEQERPPSTRGVTRSAVRPATKMPEHL